MARKKGTFQVSANYEPLKAAPFDARSLVETKEDLFLADTWTINGIAWVYNGMLVAVFNDTEENKGLYLLQDASNYSQENSWIKLANISQIAALETKINNLETKPVTLRRDNDYNYKKIENDFIPLKGEVCFIDIAGYGLRAKVGDGINTFAKLPYLDETVLTHIDSLIVKGYFYQNDFYLDKDHIQLLQRDMGRIYIDAITSKIYTYNGIEYNIQNTTTISNATETTAGIMKLYNTTGSNVDGTMTQSAITNELNEKFEIDVVADEEMVIFDIDID